MGAHTFRVRLLLGCALLLVGSGCSAAQSESRSPTQHDGPRTSAPRLPAIASYVALGDSYTAAPGVAPTLDEDCGRSGRNYPRLLAQRLGAELTDMSCSGATIDDLGGNGQLAAVTGSTDLVTVGIGGNDLDLLSLARGCHHAGDCVDRLPALTSRLDVVERRLSRLLTAIRKRAPQAEVVLVGYPRMVAGTTGCDELPIPDNVVQVGALVLGLLDGALESAAGRGGAVFLDMAAASEGHDICSAEPWVSGVSGTGAEIFHPNAAGQAAVAAELLASLSR